MILAIFHSLTIVDLLAQMEHINRDKLAHFAFKGVQPARVWVLINANRVALDTIFSKVQCVMHNVQTIYLIRTK